MRIHLHSTVFQPSIGGVETVGELLARHWMEAGAEVKVTTDTPGPDAGESALTIIRKPKAREVLALTRWADVVFHNHPCTRLSWAPPLCRKPWFATVHTWLPMYQPSGNLRKRARAAVQRQLVSKCRFIAVSRAVARHLPDRRAPVLPNPCRFPYLARGGEQKRPVDLLFVGRLVSDKGVDLLIEALARLAQEKHYFKTKIIGDGPMRSTLNSKLESCHLDGLVDFTGTLSGEAVRGAYCSARYTVVPSRWEEPFGLVAIEALACGSVPIVADSGGLPEAVGPHGIVFPCGDADALAGVLRRISEKGDEAADAGTDRSTVAKWLERHDPEVVARRYLDLFREAV